MYFTCFVLLLRELIALGALLSASAVLAGGIGCERIEYAQLKDSSKKELTAAYCSAVAMADLNKDLLAFKKELFEKQLALGVDTSAALKGMKEYGEAQVSCVSVSEAASSMLQKKYSSKAPRACK